MFVAAACLVVNDVARLVFPFAQQTLVMQDSGDEEQDDNSSQNAYSFFEEEVKSTSHKERLQQWFSVSCEVEASVAHLIKDDKVRHLAFIPIFSPPPNLSPL